MKRKNNLSVLNRLGMAKAIVANPIEDLTNLCRTWHISFRFQTQLRKSEYVKRIDDKWTWVKQYPDEKMIERIMKLENAQKKKPPQPELNLQAIAQDGLSETAIHAIDRIYHTLSEMRQEIRSQEVRLMNLEGRLNGKPKPKRRFHFPIKFQKIITKE